MRLGWVLFVVCGCYHPNAALDVPCSADKTCPDNQLCDTSLSPPLCVASIADAHPSDVSRVIDASLIDATQALIDAALDAPSATVPISFVQVKSVAPTAKLTTLTLNAAVTAHDAIIVCLNYPSTTGLLVDLSDDLGNTYDVVVGPIDAGGDLHYVAVALDVIGGTDSVTLTLPLPPNGADLFVLEYAGLALANAFDVSAHQSGTTTAMTSGNATTTSAHELVLGYAEADAATRGTGFANRETLNGNMVEDQVVNATGAYSATATTTTATTWTMIMATFRGQ
jgi:hypothetical protein